MKEQEIWRATEFPTYEVSNMGRVRRTKMKKGKMVRYIIRGKKIAVNYLVITPFVNHVRKYVYIHHLVARAFHGARPMGKVVDHIDGNTLNNRADNLQYITQRDNIAKGKRAKRVKVTRIGDEANARIYRCMIDASLDLFQVRYALRDKLRHKNKRAARKGDTLYIERLRVTIEVI